jgi:general secretion pathway protein F
VPVYAYKGVTPTGKAIRGQVNAESARAARTKMRQDGIFLTEINESGQAAAAIADQPAESALQRLRTSLNLHRRIPAMERAVATRQLSTLVGAGIPLVESLGAVVEQLDHAHLKSVMSTVREKVNEGSSLADALEATGQFDTLYVSMIRAGEAGGALDQVLARIADYLEEQVRLANKVGGILVYPIFMLLFTTLVVVALVTVVLPRITGLLAELDQELPFYTRWIIGISTFTRSWWWAMILGAVAAGLSFRAVIRTERGGWVYDRAKLRLPVLGRINRVIAIARISRTLSTLLSGGVGIIHSLDIARHVAGSRVMANVIDTARTGILEGATLSTPLRASGEFPAMVTTMIEVGERSGELEVMLGRVAQTYDEQVETAITRLTALLEPLLILVMVGIVLVIILATLLPLLQVTQSIM